MRTVYNVVTFSHLRWDFVFQRPQHLMTHLAHQRRVMFIEEPVYYPDAIPAWEHTRPIQNIDIYRLRTPCPTPGFHNDHLPILKPMIRQLLEDQGMDNYINWMYTPMALPLARSLAPQAVVYDCMDELSAFLHAPPDLLTHEANLLEWSDLVFTGGPSLYRAKRDRHQHVHCFPSSVDANHFGKARTGPEADDQIRLPWPRLGFYGVIDERVDLQLIRTLADAHPEWQIIMIGPVVKIDPQTLPQRSNIHYFGQRQYDQLPAYLAGWDVCLLPFALNESTRFISPTKTLEYMAAERPIVSTPITDVAEPYGEIVYLAGSPEEFISACEQALASGAEERATRTSRMRSILARTSWSNTAQEMHRLIDNVIQTRMRRHPADRTTARVPSNPPLGTTISIS